MLFVLHFLVERHDKIGKPGTTPDGVVTADTWDGHQITQGQTFNGVVVSTLNDTTYHEEQTKSLGVWGWIYGTKVEDWRPSAPTTSINPFTENQPLKGWFRDQLAPIISLLWTGALLTMLGIAGTEDLNSDLWQTLLWMETLTNEVVNVIFIYAILKFAQKDVSKGTKDMAEKIYSEINRDDAEFNKEMQQKERRARAAAKAVADAKLKTKTAESPPTLPPRGGGGNADNRPADYDAAVEAALAAAKAADATAATEADAAAKAATAAALAKKTKVVGDGGGEEEVVLKPLVRLT